MLRCLQLKEILLKNDACHFSLAWVEAKSHAIPPSRGKERHPAVFLEGGKPDFLVVMITNTIQILGNLCLSQSQFPNPLNEHHCSVRIPCSKSPHQIQILMMRQDGASSTPHQLKILVSPGACSPPARAVCTMAFVQRHMPSFYPHTEVLKDNASFRSTIRHSCSLLESSGWNHQVSGSHWKLETTLAWVKVMVNAPSSRFFKFSLQIESRSPGLLTWPSQVSFTDLPRMLCSESGMS